MSATANDITMIFFRFALLLGCGCTSSVTITITEDDVPAVSDVVEEAGQRPACGESQGSCNIVSGVGCPRGQGCYFVGGQNSCGAAGAGTRGSPCRMPLDCAPGYTCATAEMRCTKRCCDDADCTIQGSTDHLSCFADRNTPGRGYCNVSGCDLFNTTSNGCPPDLPYCTFGVGVAMTPVPGCYSQVPGAGALGARCTSSSPPYQCRPGHVCIDDDHTCHRVCDPSNPSLVTCPSGQRCMASSVPGFAYGACI